MLIAVGSWIGFWYGAYHISTGTCFKSFLFVSKESVYGASGERAAEGPKSALYPPLLLQLEKVLTSSNRGMDFSAYAVADAVFYHIDVDQAPPPP